MTNTVPIAIVGAGGCGREVAWLIDEINAEKPTYELLGFIDDTSTSTPEGIPIIDTVDGWVAHGGDDVRVVCAIGDSFTRLSVVDRLEQAQLPFATLVHPTVRKSRWVTLAPGSIVCAGSILTTNIRVGRNSIIGVDCTVGHDSHLADFCSLMPGVHVAGNVGLCRGVYIGTGANLVNGVSVGEWTVVGAGAVVASNLPSGQIAVGVPAKAIKANPRVPSESLL